MRPYNLYGRWVDLDTIQSINQPTFDRYDNIVISWHHAFREQPDEMNFGREVGYPDHKLPAREWDNEYKRLVEAWRAKAIPKYYEEVFVPFFTAWCGKHPKEFECPPS